MLKTIPVVLAVPLLMMAFSGCANQNAADQAAWSQFPQVHVEDASLKNDIMIQTVTPLHLGTGPLQVDITVLNKTDHNLELGYRYHFVDGNGTQLDSDTDWQKVRVPKNGTETIEFVSLTAAADFRVELRREKRSGRFGRRGGFGS